jgi:hypothetical protein
MSERRVSVRLSAVGGEKLKAELAAVGREGQQSLERLSGAANATGSGLGSLGRSASSALRQMEALAARANGAAAAMRAAGASTGTLTERIDQITGVARGMQRSAADIAAYGAALTNLRARHNPLFAVIRQYRQSLAEIREAHAVGAISAQEMAGAISRERQEALAGIAAIKGRTNALGGMGKATRMAAMQQRILAFQLNDVFVSLASGVNPLMVFIQQGAQISQIYGPEQGGVGRALRETGRMVTGLVTRFPLLTTAVAVGMAAIAGMTHEINRSSNAAVGFGDVALATWQVVADGIANFLKPAIDAIAPWFAAAWEAVIAGAKLAGNFIINGFRIAFEDIRFIWNALPSAIGAAVIAAANATIAAVEAMANRTIDLINALVEKINAVLVQIPGMEGAYGIDRLDHVSIDRLENQAADDFEMQREERSRRMADIAASDPLGEFFGAVQQRAIANALGDIETAAENAGEAMKRTATENTDPWEGLREVTEKTGSLIDEALTRGFDAAGDAVAEFVRTGKVDFSSLVTSMLADLARLAVQQALLGPLSNFLGGSLGSLGSLGAAVLHDGGIAGQNGTTRTVPALAFAGAPRFHNGSGVLGLKPDEVPAILQRGERVLSRRQAREWEERRGVQININTPDVEGFRRARTQIAADIARAVAFGSRGL